jgi:ribosome biogenesis GTPase
MDSRKHSTASGQHNASSGQDSIKGLVIARYGQSADIELDDLSIRRCAIRKTVDPVVCGDQVTLEVHNRDEYVITGLAQRRNLLTRPDKYGGQKRIAANIDQILVVCTASPLPSTDQIDRYIIAAELLDITPVLLVNKIDLLNPADIEGLEDHLHDYESVGYKVVYSSTKSENGLQQLLEALSDKTSILVGVSGVGKSSIVKCLLPDTTVRIGDVSEKTGQGRHTTTTARLYHLPCNADIIDSPGIRQFSLWRVTAEDVVRGYREFRAYADKCRFHNCRHTGEPGCAVAEAAAAGDISRQRLEDYRRILDSIGE